MRLPSAPLDDLWQLCGNPERVALLGSLSFEERSTHLAARFKALSPKSKILLLHIADPPDAFPDHSLEIRRRVDANNARLMTQAVAFTRHECKLLESEDVIIEIYGHWKSLAPGAPLVLDITSLPKRYFCFLLKLALLDRDNSDVIVTYTEASLDGYAAGHLAEDPMTCDHLPGFAAPPPPRGSTLVVAVGFESLSIQSILEVYRDRSKHIKLLVPFPPGITSIRRQWDTIRQLASDQTEPITQENLEVVAAWDAELVYSRLSIWHEDSEGLTLAPFGPKPHSLGMALFAIKHDCGMYYTQPKSYHPAYSSGVHECHAYVVKWHGRICFEHTAT